MQVSAPPQKATCYLDSVPLSSHYPNLNYIVGQAEVCQE